MISLQDTVEMMNSEDYKNRKSRMQKEFLLTLMATLFAIALVITYVLSNFK